MSTARTCFELGPTRQNPPDQPIIILRVIVFMPRTVMLRVRFEGACHERAHRPPGGDRVLDVRRHGGGDDALRDRRRRSADAWRAALFWRLSGAAAGRLRVAPAMAEGTRLACRGAAR